jgi:signal peptidase II
VSAPSIGAGGKIRLLALIAVVVLSADLVTKIIGVAGLEGREPIRILGGLVYLQLVRNPGAAFSLATGYTWVLTLIAVVVVLVIIRVARRLRSTGWAVALGLILGGAVGNLTDRIFRSPGVFEGAVVDFIAPKHFAVFNLADSAIVCGGILIVLLSFKGLDPDGTVHKD